MPIQIRNNHEMSCSTGSAVGAIVSLYLSISLSLPHSLPHSLPPSLPPSLCESFPACHVCDRDALGYIEAVEYLSNNNTHTHTQLI